MRAISALVVAAGMALVVPVRADDAARKSDPRAAFAESDLNRDGVIDRGEFQTRMVEVFYAADVNYWKTVWYWQTPETTCVDGRTNVKCKGFDDWVNAWKDIKG